MTATAFALAVVLTAAAQYQRTKVDSADPGSHCLLWTDSEIVFRQNPRGNADIAGDGEFLAFEAALDGWNAAAEACSSVVLREGPRTSFVDTSIGWVEDSPDNQNLVVYRRRDCDEVVPAGDGCLKDLTCQNKYDCWDQANATIAVTTATYHPKLGRIYDSDIEGNERWFIFTTVDWPECPRGGPYTQACIATDVQNTMTHELGHSLGLDHVPVSTSTMFARADTGEITKRDVDLGTQQFLCDAYPRNGIPLDCVTVRAQSGLGDAAPCSAAPGAAAGALAAWAFALRRRRARR